MWDRGENSNTNGRFQRGILGTLKVYNGGRERERGREIVDVVYLWACEDLCVNALVEWISAICILFIASVNILFV